MLCKVWSTNRLFLALVWAYSHGFNAVRDKDTGIKRMNFSSQSAICALSMAFFGAGFSAPALAHQNYKNVEVAFVLDTTGSMSGLIEGAKQKIWSIANEILDVNGKGQTKVKFALIGYRDRQDAYVTKSFDMTDDLHGIYGHLLELKAQGGGDRPESVNQALSEAVEDINWSSNRNTLRMVFLVGDAPPHMDYDNETQYPQTAKNANRHNIILNTIQAGNDQETARIWRRIADLGQGDYVTIAQNGGMQFIQTPYDQRIKALQQQVNQTSLGYGSARAQSAFRSKKSLAMAASGAVASDMAEYRFKAGKKNQVITGTRELVEDFEDGKVELESLSDAQLPDELKELSPKARKEKVEALVAKRTALNQQLEGLLQKREHYVDAKRKDQEAGNKDGFDTKVRKTIKQQMKKGT